ncbi:PAS domain S-box protein, partial [bacterium]|nr:PAS domain S-box protein [bacterium]
MFYDYYTSDNANLAFRSLFEHSHDAVFFLDLDGKHIAANKRAVNLLGYTLEELQESFVSQTSGSPEESMGVLARLKAGEDIPLYERTFRRKDGTEVCGEVSVVMVKDVHGNPLHIQSVIRDITNRKRNEQALRAANDYLEALVTSIPDTIFVISEEGQFIDFRASDGLLYNEPKEFLGGSYKNLLPPTIVEKYEKAIADVRHSHRIAELNYTLPIGHTIRHFN